MSQPFEIMLREARPPDADAIGAIDNQGIEDRLATFETRHRTVDELEEQIRMMTDELAIERLIPENQR